MIKVLVVAVLSMASPAFAQAISGTVSARFTGFNEFGQPNTHVEMNLACGLSCPPAAPELTFNAGIVDGFFAIESMQECANLSFGFTSAVRTTGMAVTDTTNFPAGSNCFIKARSVTCQCGNRTGEGGFIEILSSTVSIPPWIAAPSPSPKPGEFYVLLVSAAPRLSETVTVTVRGAGADFNATFPASDFRSTSTIPTAVSKRLDVPFTQAGTVTVTAVVTGGPVATKTFEVVSGGATGGGSGGGSATGGGSGGGGEDAPEGCTSVPTLAPLTLALLALINRRQA
ncbi:MAG: hypothetical protein Q8K32_07620 [Archangium sp.]|nr:hypothetical protein [Archangium sp.]